MGHHFYQIQFTSQIMTVKEIHHTRQKNNNNKKPQTMLSPQIYVHPVLFLYLENLSANWIKATILFWGFFVFFKFGGHCSLL